ncbi:MAG: isochorismatase family protein [Thermodesulfobacteriota bacterium]
MTETVCHLAPDQCAVLVVDIQERLMQAIPSREAISRSAVLLVKAAKVMGVPVIATTQYAARIGALLPEVAAELEGVAPLDKLEFDCFGNDGIAAALAGLPARVDTVVVCGAETHICVYQTVLGGLMAGRRMWVMADGVGSRAQLNHETGLSRIREIGGVVANTELVIYEWLRQAGTPAFKALLPFIK